MNKPIGHFKKAKAKDWPCSYCGMKANSFHHLITKWNSGMGMKPDDFFKFPLCMGPGTKGCHEKAQEYKVDMRVQIFFLLQWHGLEGIFVNWKADLNGNPRKNDAMLSENLRELWQLYSKYKDRPRITWGELFELEDKNE